MRETDNTGYGIVMPSLEEMVLEEPETIRQGGKFGVKLKATAPSIHNGVSKRSIYFAKGGMRTAYTTKYNIEIFLIA